MKKDIRTVEVEGITVEIDVSYAKSWPGLILASRLRADDIETGEKAMAMVEYYDRACPNIKSVWQALDTDDADVEDVNMRIAQLVSEAVKIAAGKN